MFSEKFQFFNIRYMNYYCINKTKLFPAFLMISETIKNFKLRQSSFLGYVIFN
jgi:hypothetical protein